jgi:hypothetical protein
MTPAEELLAAVKEHATADVSFDFTKAFGGDAVLYVGEWRVVPRDGKWFEVARLICREHEHDSASSAVYSAFLRARGKQQA